jgi:hypothetical protein
MLSARNEARLRQANRMSRRGAAAVARASRERLNSGYGRPVHPTSTDAAKMAMGHVRQGFADARSLRMVAKPVGMHGTPLGRISTPRVASLLSGYLGTGVQANMGALGRASMGQGYHGPLTMREMPVPAFSERGARRMTAKRVGAKSANRAKTSKSKGKTRAKSA